MTSVGQQDFARFNIICGTNGTGKSTMVDKILQATHFKNALVYIESIDLNGNPFKGLPTIPLTQYRGGKVTIDADEIPFDRFITAVTNKYRNGILVIDEAGMYQLFEAGQPIEPLKKLLKQRRKYNVEIYLLYHGVSEIPVRLFKWVNNLILFHQTDEFKHKAAVIPRIDELRAAQTRIKVQYFKGNVHYCERIQLS